MLSSQTLEPGTPKVERSPEDFHRAISGLIKSPNVPKRTLHIKKKFLGFMVDMGKYLETLSDDDASNFKMNVCADIINTSEDEDNMAPAMKSFDFISEVAKKANEEFKGDRNETEEGGIESVLSEIENEDDADEKKGVEHKETEREKDMSQSIEELSEELGRALVEISSLTAALRETEADARSSRKIIKEHAETIIEQKDAIDNANTTMSEALKELQEKRVNLHGLRNDLSVSSSEVKTLRELNERQRSDIRELNDAAEANARDHLVELDNARNEGIALGVTEGIARCRPEVEQARQTGFLAGLIEGGVRERARVEADRVANEAILAQFKLNAERNKAEAEKKEKVQESRFNSTQ